MDTLLGKNMREALGILILQQSPYYLTGGDCSVPLYRNYASYSQITGGLLRLGLSKFSSLLLPLLL